MIERRSVLLGLGALFAAPVIVKASSLMKVAPTEMWRPLPHQLLAIDQITREAVEMFINSNEAIKEINRQYEADYKFVSGEQWDAIDTATLKERQKHWNEFAADDSAKIGDVLRIRLPNDYVVSDGRGLLVQNPAERYDFAMMTGSGLRYVKERRMIEAVPQIPDSLAVAAVAVAAVPVLLAKPVTRRFWSK